MHQAVPDSIVIGRAVLEDIAAHARAEAPNECCGLLVGSLPQVDASVRARNLRAWRPRSTLTASRMVRRALGLAQPRLRYLVDPRDHFAAIKLARRTGRSVVGAYHSHPGAPPVPSPTDLREASDTAFVHVIVSPRAGSPSHDIRAWRLEEGRFHEVRVVPG